MCKIYRLLLLGSLFITGLSSKAQSTNWDDRLVHFYGMEHLNKMDQTSPGTVDYLNYYIKYGYTIIHNVPDEKLSLLENITSVKKLTTEEFLTIDDIEKLNILELGIKRRENQHLSYRIGNTNSMIVFISPKEVRRRYEEEVKNE